MSIFNFKKEEEKPPVNEEELEDVEEELENDEDSPDEEDELDGDGKSPKTPSLEDQVAELTQGIQLLQEQLKVATKPGKVEDKPQKVEVPDVLDVATPDDLKGLVDDEGKIDLGALNKVLTKAIKMSTDYSQKMIVPEIKSTVSANSQEQRLWREFERNNSDLEDITDFVESVYEQYRVQYPNETLDWVLQNTEAYVRKAVKRPRGSKTKKTPPNLPKSKGGNKGGDSKLTQRQRTLRAFRN